VIHDTNRLWQRSQCVFQQIFRQAGWQDRRHVGVTADQQDFTAELTQIKALNPEVIYFGGLTPIGVRVRSQMDKLGIKAVFDGTSGIVSDAFIQGLGPLAEGALAFREGARGEAAGREFFLENYAAQKYDKSPEAYGAFSYAAWDLISTRSKRSVRIVRRSSRIGQRKDRDSIIARSRSTTHGQNTVALITNTWSRTASRGVGTTANTPPASASFPGQK